MRHSGPSSLAAQEQKIRIAVLVEINGFASQSSVGYGEARTGIAVFCRESTVSVVQCQKVSVVPFPVPFYASVFIRLVGWQPFEGLSGGEYVHEPVVVEVDKQRYAVAGFHAQFFGFLVGCCGERDILRFEGSRCYSGKRGTKQQRFESKITHNIKYYL